MYRVIRMFLTAATLLSLFVACAPAAITSDSQTAEPTTQELEWETNLEIHGMPVVYTFVDTPPVSTGALEFNYSPFWKDDHCEIHIYERAMSEITAANLAYSVGSCFGHVIYEEDDLTEDEFFTAVTAYGRAYAESYEQACGSNRSPLINSAGAAECTIPDL